MGNDYKDDDSRPQDEQQYDSIVGGTEPSPSPDEASTANDVDTNTTPEETAVLDSKEAAEVTSDAPVIHANEPKKTPDEPRVVFGAVEDITKKPINFSKYFLYTLVVGLVVSALISVVAVLTGEFNSTLGRALGTTGSMVAHTLIALFLISVGNRDGKTAGMFINTLLLITVGSFITSVLGIWEIVSGRTAGDMYLILFYTFCASLWIQLLLKVGKNKGDKPTRIASLTGVGFTALFYILLLPTVFTHYPDKLPEFHYRALAAVIIILATASVLTTVFHRIHAFRHPESRVRSKDNGMDILLAVVVVFIGLPIIAGIMSTISSYSYESRYDASKYAQREALERRNEIKKQNSKEPYEKVASERRLTYGLSSVDKAMGYKSCDIMNRNLEVLDSHFFEFQSASAINIELSTRGANVVSDYMDDFTVSYNKNTIAAYDSDCKVIDIADITKGDAVRLYYDAATTSGEVSLLNDKLAAIQRVETSN